MSPKLKKTIVKLVIGQVFAAAIGYAIKLEHKIDERIDGDTED